MAYNAEQLGQRYTKQIFDGEWVKVLIARQAILFRS